MEKHHLAQEKAKKCLMVADHMMNVTYPIVKDPKLLLGVIENIFLAQTNMMAAVLHFHRYYKLIPPFHDTFESKFNMFNAYISKTYKIKQDYTHMIREIKDMLVSHKKSPVEFSRKDALVICEDNYRLKTITPNMLKRYVTQTKEFMTELERIINAKITG